MGHYQQQFNAVSTVSYFLTGKNKWLKKYTKGFYALKESQENKRHKDEDEDIWGIDSMVFSAKNVLSAMKTKGKKGLSPDEVSLSGSDDLSNLRLLGAYVCGEKEGVYANKVNIEYGLPSGTYTATPRKGNGKKTCKCIIVSAEKLSFLPVGKVCEHIGVPYQVNVSYAYNDFSATFDHYVVIGADGTVHKTKKLVTDRKTIRSKRDKIIKMIPSTRWIEDDIAKEKAENFGIVELTAWSINVFQLINSNVTVRIDDNKDVCNFSITMSEAKRLFKDRVKAKTPNGRTKTIIHWVKAHYRNRADGVSTVKTHIRGARKFEWNGLNVEVLLHGKHNTSIADLTHETSMHSEVPWYVLLTNPSIRKEYKKQNERKKIEDKQKTEVFKNPLSGEKLEFISMEK